MLLVGAQQLIRQSFGVHELVEHLAIVELLDFLLLFGLEVCELTQDLLLLVVSGIGVVLLGGAVNRCLEDLALGTKDGQVLESVGV